MGDDPAKDAAVAASSNASAPMPEVSLLRFSDILDELEAIAGMGHASDDPTGLAVAAACKRAGQLLTRLRAQFVDEVVLAPAVPVHGHHQAS